MKWTLTDLGRGAAAKEFVTYQPGTILKGKYKILSELGEGGFGTVYKAEDLSLERIVALKVLRSNLLLNNDEVSRIKVEAQVLAKLMHANIVTVFAFEMLDDTVPVVVMEYIEGKTLAKRISEAGMDYDCFNDVLSQVCTGLQFAHENSVIHRDLSPRNILLVEEENRTVAKIIDFGLSKLLNPTAEGQNAATTITATGYVVGNPQYMSPEVCLGMKADSISDIYSLGCILYEMLCGHSLFSDADAIATLYKQQHEYPPIPELYWDAQNCEQLYQDITLLCLQKERNKRPQSAAEIIACLEDPKKLQHRLSSASAWRNERVDTGGGILGFAILACFAFVAICGTAIYLSTKKVDVKQVQLGPAQVKHIEPKSVASLLFKLQNFLADPSGPRVASPAELKQKVRELDQFIGNRGMDPIMKFLVHQYRADLIMLESVSNEEKIEAWAKCIPFSLTATGRDTQQTSVILYHMATLSANQEHSYKYAKRAFAVYESDECETLDIPKEFRVPQNFVPTGQICALLAGIEDQKGNSAEALRWLQLGVKKSGLDPNWRFQEVCNEAAYLRKLGRMPEARAALKNLLTQLSDSATFDPHNAVFEPAANNNIRNTIKLGDWCLVNGFEDFAKSCYSRAAELIEQTGLCQELKESTAEKLRTSKRTK